MSDKLQLIAFGITSIVLVVLNYKYVSWGVNGGIRGIGYYAKKKDLHLRKFYRAFNLNNKWILGISPKKIIILMLTSKLIVMEMLAMVQVYFKFI